jgi:hypothetical protein
MRAQGDERIGGEPAARRSAARLVLFAVLSVAVIAALVFAARELLRPAPGTQPGAAVGGSAGAPAQRQAATTASEPGAAAPLPAEPVAPAAAASPPLPALAESDTEVRVALAAILPAVAHPALAPDDLLRRAAAIADGFGRGKLVRDKLPLPAIPGKPIVVTRGGRTFLDPANYARYDLVASAVASLDTDALARWFRRYEPLFQQAYEELGNGDARVRDAILRGIGIMLAAPAPATEPELTQPAVYYKFADPALEALPDAQKLLIRIGPANRERVASTLTRLRDALGS